MAKLPKLTALTNMLKDLNFQFLSHFWLCLNSRQKILSVTWPLVPQFDFSILSIFQFFFLGIDQEVFYFYQLPKSFDFHPLVPQRVWRFFSSIDLPVSLYHLLLGFGGFLPTTITMLIIFLHAHREREREKIVFRQFSPSRGIRRLSIKRRHVAPSTRRFYLSRPL